MRRGGEELCNSLLTQSFAYQATWASTLLGSQVGKQAMVRRVFFLGEDWGKHEGCDEDR